MSDLNYIFETLLIYGLAFQLSFFVILIYNHKAIKKLRFKNYVGGAMMAVISATLILIVHLLGFTGVPDGKFLLSGYTAFFFGLGPSLLVVLTASIIKQGISGDFTTILTVCLLQVTLFYAVKRYYGRQQKNMGYKGFVVVTLVSTLVSFSATGIIDGNNLDLLIAKGHPMQLSLLAVFLMLGLGSMILRELERNHHVLTLEKREVDLMNQNTEIQALYEEMSASEETLQANYDELKKYKEQVEFLAFHEVRTGFFNRDYLYYQLSEWKQRGDIEPMTLVIVGVRGRERLKKSLGNLLFDTLHYLVGVEIKSAVAKMESSNLYSLSDGLYGVLIEKSISHEILKSNFRDVKKCFLEPLTVNAMELLIDVDAGVVLIDDLELNTELWVDFAENAYLNASESDEVGALVWFEQISFDQYQRQYQMERLLKKAVEKEELSLVFQPQYNREDKIIGAEALLRWHNPEMGSVSPSEFIAIAEANGFIDEIGQFVIEETCKVLLRLKNDFLILNKVPIAINASFLELMSPKYVSRLKSLLNQYTVPTELIHIEITESAISNHYKEVMMSLDEIKKHEIEIHLDDFGTGYSSLNHLGSMPVQVLKIDKTFIDRMLEDDKIGNLIELMIEFAHRLDLKVIAEGVETKLQYKMLKKLNCDAFQGYYFSKPVEEDVFCKMLRKHPPSS